MIPSIVEAIPEVDTCPHREGCPGDIPSVLLHGMLPHLYIDLLEGPSLAHSHHLFWGEWHHPVVRHGLPQLLALGQKLRHSPNGLVDVVRPDIAKPSDPLLFQLLEQLGGLVLADVVLPGGHALAENALVRCHADRCSYVYFGDTVHVNPLGFSLSQLRRGMSSTCTPRL